MDITFNDEFKSIQPFEWRNVPPFAVITGLNGTGKSQLLHLISATVMNSPHIKQRVEIIGEAFRPNEITYLAGEWQLEGTSPYDLASNSTYLDQLYNLFNRGNVQFGDEFQQSRIVASIDAAVAKLGKRDGTVTRDEFVKALPSYILHREAQMPQQISKVFFDYFLSTVMGRYQGKDDARIREEFGEPPWEVLRSIIQEAKLPFNITDPCEMELTDKFHLKLSSSITGAQINFEDLSSGEKVLISLVFYLYSSREKNVFSRLLLLDEPDAHLHPSMSRDFINVMKNVLVDQYGARVIMTTHSPSTIALAPEDAIFTAHREGERIQKASKDSALKLLTTGVPSFSVNYENRRQVFVESKYDVYFYEKIYGRIQNRLEPEISLTFISSGESRTDKNGQPISSCDQVINITSVLRNASNNFVWGLIDWDKRNDESAFVKVLGPGRRYAIENYLFDPLLVACLLLRGKYIKREEIGLSDSDTHVDMKHLEPANLQAIADFIIDAVRKNVIPSVENTNDHEIIMGMSITIPDWYTTMRGHELEEKILITFPALNSLKNGEYGLKRAIVDLVIDDVPELISDDFRLAFLKLQSV